MITQRWMILLLLAAFIAPTLTEAASSQPIPIVAVVPIQIQLRALGYNPGPIDGRGGRRTIGALTAYARDRGIVLNEATVGTVVARLRAEASVMLLNDDAIEAAGAPQPQSEPRLLSINP